MEASGLFRFRWIAVALALLPPLLLVLWPLLRSLPPRVRAEFLVSGAIFLGGSVGLEGVGGLVASSGAGGGVWYDLLNVAENGAEVVGIALFVGASVRYVARTVPQPSTEVDSSFGGAP